MNISPRVTALLALLALVPIAIYVIETGRLDPASTALAVGNVVLIAGALFFLFGGAPGERAHEDELTQ